MEKYQPGVCNIGKSEVRKRYAFAVVGFALTVLAVSAIVLLKWPKLTLLVSFIPLAMGFEGLYQGYFKFCAGFAAAGITDFKGSGGSRSKVADASSHKKDLKKAKQIHLFTIISAIILVAVIYLVL
jgi:hypothetical protein